MKSEFKGSILAVRATEDCIRATKKYTKGAFSKVAKHPMQGGDFPSRMLTEYYEVYPDMAVDWNMSAANAWAWVWGDVTHIDVLFQYDYRCDKAKIIVHGGQGAVRELAAGIPGLSESLAKVVVADHSDLQEMSSLIAPVAEIDVQKGKQEAA